MTPKFNPKAFQGKKRVYTAVPRAPRISRLWVWDDVAQEYRTPEQGNTYYAARYEAVTGGDRKRVYESFPTLEMARAWQSGEELKSVEHLPANAPVGPLFRDVVAQWKRRRYPQLAYSTQVQYEKMLRLHFGGLLGHAIEAITPQRIDRWLDELKETCRVARRASFDHELTLLSNIIRYYINYNVNRLPDPH